MRLNNWTFMIAIIIVFSGCDKKSTSDEAFVSIEKNSEIEKKKSIKKVQSEFKLKTFDGKDITLTLNKEGKILSIKEKEYQNKVILLDFFATWCPPCKAEIPHLVNLRDKYKGKFEVIGILLEDGKDKNEVKDFNHTFKIKYPITVDADNRNVAGIFGGVRSIPFMVMYNPEGKYVTHYTGAVPEEMIDVNIQEALEISK